MSASFSQSSRQEGSVLSRNTRFKGEITGQEDLYLDGTLEGMVELPHQLVTIGPHGNVDATIHARQIVVQGRIKGRLQAEEKVLVTSTGVVTGEIISPMIAMQEGAWVHGNIDTRGRTVTEPSWRTSLPVPDANADGERVSV